MAEIDKYLKMMVEHGASDLHLCTGCKPIFRKDGSIVRLREDEVDLQHARALLYEIMPKRNEQEFNESHDTDFAYALEGCGRYRVNIYLDHKGICGVFRLIPSQILTLEQLKLPDSVKKFCLLNKGLVLVTGPTGSGKSPPWPPLSTRSTRPDPTISSPSRTRSSLCTRTNGAWSTSARFMRTS
jgi:twitching motility protein PilT